MFNTPGMQSMLGQIQSNPQLLSNMMQAPYIQSMMQAMTANPDMANAVIDSNPMFAGNPELQESMRRMYPTFMQQVRMVMSCISTVLLLLTSRVDVALSRCRTRSSRAHWATRA